MLDIYTNIQELFETLVKKNKKVILFGAGGHAMLWINKINQYIWYLCDDWKTPAYIEEEPVYPYPYTPIEEFIDCIVDNDNEKWGQDYCINDMIFQIKKAEYLNDINPDAYIILIVTDKYETEIKEQLERIDNLKTTPCYSFISNMHYYRHRCRGLIVERMLIPYMETVKALAYREIPEDEYSIVKSLIEQGEYVANGIAFQITTICNLKCKYCADYVPSMGKGKEMDVEQVLQDIDTFFSVTSRCLYVQLTTAEAVLCSNLDIILEKLLSMEAVQRIEIVTNGMSYPKKEKTLQLLSDPKILICMSNYNMPDKTEISRKFYEEHHINVRFLESQSWRVQGLPPYDRHMDQEQLCNRYLLCDMASVCPHQIIEGNLASCGKIQRFVKVADFSSEHDFIDLKKYQSREMLKQALINLRLEPYMEGCAWCDAPCFYSPSAAIQPAEQLTDKI